MNTTAEVEYTYAVARVGTVRPEVGIFSNEEGFPFDCGANGGMADARARVAAYGSDRLNRLIAFQDGELNANKDGITGTPANEEAWALDMTGNWPGFVQKTGGTTDLDQGRTHNPVNEITAITATTGTDWADPVHDRAGNMTTIPKPANLADGLTATYDAWNRLVEVKDGQTVIARYEYDGLNRRITSHIDSGAPSNPTWIDTYVHYYYNSAWQILETRQSDTPSAPPETLQPKHQYVWSQRYIDAGVLRDEDTGANGLCDDQRLYYLNDANFNVTALLDTSGDAVERYVFSPYGVVTIYDATWTNTRSASSYGNVTLYTGRELDCETGLYSFRNRYYGAELGRFVSRDPRGYEARDVNLQRYVENSPTGWTDPHGGIRTKHTEGHWAGVQFWVVLEYDCDSLPAVVEGGTEGVGHDFSALFWGWTVTWTSHSIPSLVTFTRCTTAGRDQKRYVGVVEGVVHLQFVYGIKVGPVKVGPKPKMVGPLAMDFDTGWFDCGECSCD